MMEQQYRKHSAYEVLTSDQYAKHISAMTVEDLHGKAEIAEELAYRDIQIERLKENLDRHMEVIVKGREANEALQKELAECSKAHASLLEELRFMHPRYLAMEKELAALKASEPVRDREAVRVCFPDDFNRWLDEGISDAGHTVFDQIGDVSDAWAGWEARPFYAPQPASEDARDAARYRWLRDQCERQELVIAKSGTWQLESWSGDDPDAAIDAAMKGTKP